MAVRVKIRDRDKGWARLKKQLAKAAGAYVKSGLPEATGGEEHEDEDGKPSGHTVAAIGWFNEFGTMRNGKEHVPERSFIRSTHDENLLQIASMKKRLLKKMLDKKMGIRKALNVLGQFMKKEIQAKIVNLRSPANAPSTIKRKDSSNPLIATGQMRQSVDYEVVLPKGGAKRARFT